MATESRYDVVIVGARCAGATLATFLARGGASVVLLDKDRLPSDQILSTHTIHPPGLDFLDESDLEASRGNACRRLHGS
jgi:menaquinone-9 beta-reductase